MVKYNTNTLLLFMVNLFIGIYFILMLVVKNGYAYGPILLTLISLPFLFMPSSYTKLTWKQKRTPLIFLFYFAVMIISVFVDKDPLWRDIDLPSRVLIGCAIFILLYRYRPSFSVIAWCIGLGAMGSGLLAVYQKFILGEERALSSFTLVIQAGDISMALGLMSLAFLVFFYRKKNISAMVFFLFAAILGMAGSFLSGSRGGWVLMPLILISFYWFNRHYFSRKFNLSAIVIIVVLVCIGMLPKVGIVDRFAQAGSDISQFTSSTNKDTSLGVRFQLWHSAWGSFLDKPIFGWGDKGIQDSRNQQMEKGIITPYIANFNSHAHNEYLNEMANRGIIGLIALLAIFMVPLTQFKRIFTSSQEVDKTKTIAMAGYMAILSSMDFCLSQGFFRHISGSMFYFTTIAILLSYCLSAYRQNMGNKQ